jgi:hypothetical protein
MIEAARNPEEAWRMLKSYFDRETGMLDRSIEEILSHGRMVNDSQTLAHYSRILMAIRDAKQIGRLSDLLTDERIGALMERVPRKENGYWGCDLKGVRPKDRPVVFYSFVRFRALELGSNTAPFRFQLKDPEELEPAWEGPCLMGDLCGGSHVPEECDLFIGLSQRDRLAVVAQKRLCYLCFRHADNRPCQLQSSLPSCSIGGCMRMHSRLLHGALQEEDARILVVEIEVQLRKPEADEECYAADFETLGQEDEVEEGSSEVKAPLLGGMDEEHGKELSLYDHPGEDGSHPCQQSAGSGVEGDLAVTAPEGEAPLPDDSDGEHDEEPASHEHSGEEEPHPDCQPGLQEIEEDLTGTVPEEEALTPDGADGGYDEEPSPYEHPDEDRPRLCQQLIQLEIDGELTTLHTLYDWETPNTLVRTEGARRIGLQGVRIPKQAIKGYQGVGTITDSVYHVPLVDADGNVQVIRAYGVEEITVVSRARLPPLAKEIFPIIRLAAPWMETEAGHVELLIGLDHKQWLPVHVEDCWNPDDDMRLVRSAFGHRYMITDGWGRDLLPPDNSPDDQAGAQGGEDEQEETAQEVQLPEYKGWSQGTGVPRSGNGSSVTAQRGGGMGARPKNRRPPPNQVAPPARGGASREDRPRGSGQEPGPPARTQFRFGSARPQASGGARPRLRMVPPPKRRPSPSPPPAQGQRSWDWSRRPRRGQGPRGTDGRRTPYCEERM